MANPPSPRKKEIFSKSVRNDVYNNNVVRHKAMAEVIQMAVRIFLGSISPDCKPRSGPKRSLLSVPLTPSP